MSAIEDERPTMVEKGEASLPSIASIEDGTSNRSLPAAIPKSDSMDEIPVNGPMRGLSVRSGVADLPTAEEVRNDPGQIPGGGGWTKKKIMIVSGVVIVLLAIIVGVSVGVSNKNKNEATASSASISDEAQRVRLSSVASFLIDEGISPEDAVMTAGSPQNRATAFMAIEDGAQLEVPLSTADPLAFKFIQRYALATFYYALGGESWKYAMNFLTPDDTCLWFQTLLTTGGQRNNFGAQCSLNGHVRVILLPWNNMAGELPPEIGLLTALEFVAIPSNIDVRGALPSEMKKLTNLEFLMLSQNKLNGPVPEWIGDLTKLTSLVLGDNAFQSSIPMTIRNLDQLSLLSLDGNTLDGQLDAVEHLTNLRFLYLEKNQLEQTLGSDTLRNLTKLEQLDLSDNIFDGRVPRHLLHMSALDVLDLSDNILSGKLPSTIPRNSALNFLFLHGNQLSGDIPSSFFNLTALNQLDLSDNKFTGLIPSFLGNFTNMIYLFLSNNDFDRAPIPEFLPQMGNLRDLSLKSTNRTGTIPGFIGEMTSLLLLDLDGNELTGSLPTELGLLTYLGLLLLNRNKLTGTIPSQVSNMTNLAMILLDNNTITGDTAPACGLEKLQVFIADCGGDNPEVDCPADCCYECCEDDGPECNDDPLLAQFDPVWEDAYQRRDYQFSDDISFVPVAGQP